MAALPRRVDSVFVDLKDRLEAMGAFDVVVVGAEPGEIPIGAGTTGVWVRDDSWLERDRVDPVQYEHEGQFTVWIAVRDDNPLRRLVKKAYLEALVANAINGQALGGFCQPARSHVSSAARDPMARHPEKRWKYACTYRFLLPQGYGSHDETGPEELM